MGEEVPHCDASAPCDTPADLSTPQTRFEIALAAQTDDVFSKYRMWQMQETKESDSKGARLALRVFTQSVFKQNVDRKSGEVFMQTFYDSQSH